MVQRSSRKAATRLMSFETSDRPVFSKKIETRNSARVQSAAEVIIAGSIS